MQRMFPQVEPLKNPTNMRDILPALATVVGTIIAAIILGTTHVIGFDWIVAVLVTVMLGIMAFCTSYTLRTRRILQEQYAKDIASARNDFLKYKTETMNLRAQESEQWNNWAISFTQANAKEQKERLEDMEKRCMAAIQGAEQRLDVNMKNAMSLYKTAQETTGIIIDQYRDQLIQIQKQMQALEERLRKKQQLDTTDQLSEDNRNTAS